MSRIKLLLNVVEDLRSLADSVAAIAEVLTVGEPPDEKTVALVESEITLEQVRVALAEKSRSGHGAEVRELLREFGTDKLSGVDPGNYAELLTRAEVLGNE